MDQVQNAVSNIFKGIKNGDLPPSGTGEVSWIKTVTTGTIDISLTGREGVVSASMSKIRNKKDSIKRIVDALLALPERKQEEVPASEEKVKRTRTFVNGSRPGPRGKREDGDFVITKSVLETELSHLNLVSREVLQNAVDSRAGRPVTLQTTHWMVEKRYKNGSVRPIILLPTGFGKKCGVFQNPFFKLEKRATEVAEEVSS